MFQQWYETATTPRLCDVVKTGIEIFDDTWTTFIPEHKRTLCDKIIRYYYFNNIGCETPDRFVHYLNESLARMMPYYNQLYQSELIKIDPLLNQSIVRNGRSIENLLKKMKTDTSATGKMLRDFVNNSTGYNQNTAVTGVKSSETLDKITKNVYNKDGTDDSTTTGTVDTTDNTDRNLDKNTSENRDINETGDTNTTDHTSHKSKDTTDGLVTTDYTISEHESETEKGYNWDDGTIVDDDTKHTGGTYNKDFTEHVADKAKTVVTTGLQESTSTNARKDYADTPQIRLGSMSGSSAAAADDDSVIRKDYLTNVTWDTSSSTHNLNSTVTTNYEDDNWKTHTAEDKTDETVKVDNTQTHNLYHRRDMATDKWKTAQNQDKRDEYTTLDKEGDEWKTSDFKRNLKTDDDTVGHVVENETTDKTIHTDSKEVYDDDWTEKGNSDTIENYTLLGTKDTDAKTTGTDTREGRENESQESARTGMIGEDTSRTTDTGTTDTTKGFVNISASALLEAFRKTFLNIDQKIIDDLADNFLSVY